MSPQSRTYELAQVNVSRLLAPLDSATLKPFVDALDEVNAEGERAPGFLWRLQTDTGNATDVEGFGWDRGDSHGVIVNLTVWTDTQSLAAFVFGGQHLAVMRRRRDWFQPVAEATTALWWIRAGTRPSVVQAERRVRYLREHGPSARAFTLRRHFLDPDAALGAVQASDDRLCPA